MTASRRQGLVGGPGIGSNEFVLAERMTPVPEAFDLDAEFWSATRENRLVVQRCRSCRSWQWGPEWICSSCQSFDLGWEEVPRVGDIYRGSIYSWERVWHPTDPKLVDSVPYVVLLVELPTAGGVRMLGNLEGAQRAPIQIGTEVEAVFEHHDGYSLVQWRVPTA